MYSKRFGAEKFEIITDSKPIQDLKLDPNRVYLQLTSVEPYFEGPGEPPSGDFEESHGLTKFVYETPFTKEGKARTDDVTKQWMTKNISVTGTIFSLKCSIFPMNFRRLQSKIDRKWHHFPIAKSELKLIAKTVFKYLPFKLLLIL